MNFKSIIWLQYVSPEDNKFISKCPLSIRYIQPQFLVLILYQVLNNKY